MQEFKAKPQYDDLIFGWTQYWNKTLNPKQPLDANLVKALIASESGFNIKSNIPAGKKIGRAHGLMQLTDQTIQIFGDTQGELKNDFISLTPQDLSDPSSNICAGIRWLFRKKVTASARLGRAAT